MINRIKETYAKNVIQKFRDRMNLPNMTVPELQELLKSHNVRPYRFDERGNKVYLKSSIDNALEACDYWSLPKTQETPKTVTPPRSDRYNFVIPDDSEMGKASDELLKQGEVYYDDSYSNDEVEECIKKKKTVYITESQAELIKKMLNGEEINKKGDTLADIEIPSISYNGIRSYVSKNQEKNNFDLNVNFGKNGLGITNELEEIGKILNDLSDEYEIYLGDPYFDTMDDVYSFKCQMKKKEKENLNESKKQESLISEKLAFINPDKVNVIRKFLDKNFAKGSIQTTTDDGYPKLQGIVGLKGIDGQPVKKMSAEQLFYLLQDKFKNIINDKAIRDKFIKQVMIDWYNNKISKEGLLSKNQL